MSETRVEKLEKVLKEIYNAEGVADFIDFAKSEEMATWIILTIDKAGKALRGET